MKGLTGPESFGAILLERELTDKYVRNIPPKRAEGVTDEDTAFR